MPQIFSYYRTGEILLLVRKIEVGSLIFVCLLVRPQSVVFRFYCEEEEEDGVVYESGEWLPGESVATHYVPAVTHDCKGPDRVISGVHVLTAPYIRYWSFYCSRVGRNWTVSTNDCTNTTFAAGSGVNISSGLAFVSLVDVYTRSTYGL